MRNIQLSSENNEINTLESNHHNSGLLDRLAKFCHITNNRANIYCFKNTILVSDIMIVNIEKQRASN